MCLCVVGAVGGQRQYVGVRRDATWRALLGFLRERENVPHTHSRVRNNQVITDDLRLKEGHNVERKVSVFL